MKKIISYNINGLRAGVRKGIVNWIQQVDADVICFQETKLQEGNIDAVLFEELGYHTYWHYAQKAGYSGVAIFSKDKPKHVEIGTGIDYIDREGRVIRVDYEDYSVMSLYLPSGSNDDRVSFKFQFMRDFHDYVESLLRTHPNLIISGDYNICHQAIDIHDPVRNQKVSGFLPEEREWLSGFISLGFIDAFRSLNKEPHHYSWWTYRANARNNNKGWRIDYHLVSKSLEKIVQNSYMLPDAMHSDHCPVVLELSLT